MSDNPEVIGVIVEAQEYGPLVVLSVDAGEGEAIPIPINRGSFDEQMGRNGCDVVTAIGRIVGLERGKVFILSGGHQ